MKKSFNLLFRSALNKAARCFLVNLLIIISFLASGVLIPSYSRAQEVDRIAAIVNDKIISTHDLKERIELLVFSAGLKNTQSHRQALEPQALRVLIDELLQSQEARRLNIRLVTRDISDAIKRIEKSNKIPYGQFKDLMEKNGVSYEAVLSKIQSEIIWQKLVRRRLLPSVEIGEEEISNVYRRIISDSGQIQYRVSEVLLPFDDDSQKKSVLDLANRLSLQIRSGEKISDIAQQFSKSASASKGGDIGWIRMGELDNKVNTALSSLTIGGVSNPILTPNGYLIVQVKNKRKLENPNPDEVLISLRQYIFSNKLNISIKELKKKNAAAIKTLSNKVGCREFSRTAEKLGTPQTELPLTFRLNELNEDLRKVASKIMLGKPSKPLINTEKIQIIMVCERQTSKQLTRNQIRETLLRQRVDMLSRRYLRDLRRSAFIDLRI